MQIAQDRRGIAYGDNLTDSDGEKKSAINSYHEQIFIQF